MFKRLWIRTKEVATMYTGTFVVVMILNQLLFFGFCLNPICIVAAMPHVLVITVIIGTFLNKITSWGRDEVAGRAIKSTSKVATEKLASFNDSVEQFSNRLDSFNKELEVKLDQKKKLLSESNKKIDSKFSENSSSKNLTFAASKNVNNISNLEHKSQKMTSSSDENPCIASEVAADWLSDLPDLDEEIPCLKYGEDPDRHDDIPPWIKMLEDQNIDETPLWLDDIQKIPLDKKSLAVSYYFKTRGVASIWHVTQRSNLQNILNKGLLSNTDAFAKGNPFDISDHGVQRRREHREPIYGRKVHEYVPTYINIKNPMLYVRRSIQNDLCIIEISTDVLNFNNYIYSDGNAASRETKFYRSVNDLDKLPWDVLRAPYWNDHIDGKRKRCAEVLIFPIIEPKYIVMVHCFSADTLNFVSRLKVPCRISKELFFS